MAELGSIVLGYAVTKLLDEILSAFYHLKNKSPRLSKLQNLLERLQPSIEELKSVIQDENDPAAKWLTALRKQLEKAQDIIHESGNLNPDVIKRYYRSRCRHKKSVNVYNSIQGLLQEASALQWAAGLRVQSVFSDNTRKLDLLLDKISNLKLVPETDSKRNVSDHELVTVGVTLDTFDLVQSYTSAEGILSDRVYDIPEPPVTFVGVNKANEVIDQVLNKEYRKWVALWGMGGVGKTSTAREVYADDRIKKHFSGGRYWINVRREQASSGSHSLFKQLLKKIEGEGYRSQLPDDLQQAKSLLTRLLAKSRVLLVLDDVWQNDVVLRDLDVVSDRFNSVILVTTRDQETLRRVISVAKLFEIQQLSQDHSWQLFSWHAFSGREVSRDVDSIAREVAKECRGLPLALEVIGSTMADRELLPVEIALNISPQRAWEKALQDLRSASANCADKYEALYRKLQLSVDTLEERDPRLRDCFLYFAAFPEDQDVSVEKLVSLWSAEGLVEDDETSALSREGEEGKALLAILAARSILKVTKAGRHSKVRIHDVMRHVAQLNLRRDFTLNQDIQVPARECLYAPCLRMSALPKEWTVSATSNARRLSLRDNDFRHFAELEQFRAPQLRVLIFSNNPQLQSLSRDFCMNLSNLRVLDLQRTGIQRIPGQLLKRLQSLKLLDLSWCQELREVSDEIAGSRSLEYFFLAGCSSLQHLPPVEKLTNLKVYTTQQLTTFLRHEDISEAHDAPTCSRHDTPYKLPPNLRRLRVSRERARERAAPPCRSTKCAFDVSSLGVLRELILDHVSSLPAGILELQLLKVLIIEGSYRTASFSIPALGTLPRLEELTLRLRSVRGTSLYAHEGAFPSLKRFRISCLSGMEKFFDIHRGSMPRIETLEVVKHRRHFPTSIVELSSLKHLEVTSFSAIETVESFSAIESVGSFSAIETGDKDLEYVFRHPDCFPHLEFLRIVHIEHSRSRTRTEELQEYYGRILPRDFLERQKGKLKIEIRCTQGLAS